MYKSKIAISTKTKQQLIKKLDLFLKKYENIKCKHLWRKIYLSKLPEVLVNRLSSCTHRLKRFFVAIDIIKHWEYLTTRIEWKNKEFELIWFDKNWVEIIIHLREELSCKKDKKIFFISCY